MSIVTAPEATADLDRLMAGSYQRLHQIAVHYFRGESSCRTWQPTALVNQAYLRLAVGWRQSEMTHGQFVGLAAQTMRRILIDESRKRAAATRGAGRRRVELDEGLALDYPRAAEAIDVERSISELERWDRRKAEIVRLRYYWGLTVEEISNTLELSEATVNREWRMARAWLAVNLEGP